MNGDEPLVSIVIPTYYRNEKLRGAIENIQMLNYSNIEIIVVDDSGEGHAEPVVSEFQSINYIKLDSNLGANLARSKGIKKASGEYIQLLDDDDRLKKQKITKQLNLLQNKSDTGVAYCGQIYKSKSVGLPRKDGRGDVLSLALADELSNCVTSSLLIEGELAKEIIPLPDTPGSDDIYIKIELAKRTRFDFINEPLMLRGDSDDPRGAGSNAIRGMEDLLEEYSELYNQQPKYIKNTLIANIYHRKARTKLATQKHSVVAIYWLILSNYYYPNINIKYIGILIGSVFGKAGITTVEKTYRVITTRGSGISEFEDGVESSKGCEL